MQSQSIHYRMTTESFNISKCMNNSSEFEKTTRKMSFTSFNKGLNAMIYSLTSTHNFKTKDKINPISTPCVVNMALQKQNLIKL